MRAFRLYMLPQGVFSVAVATVLFPLLSRHASRQDWGAFQHTVGTGLRLICFLLVPASVAAAVLATPIVRLLYQHQHFTDADTKKVCALPRRIRARAHVQRDDADAEPRLLLAPVPVDPELGGAREPRPERCSGRRVLPVRDLGDPALDVAREHRRNGGAARSLPAADARLRASRHRPHLRPRDHRLRGARPAWRGGSGEGSMRGSASRSRRRSSRSAPGSRSGTPPSSECAGCWECTSSRRCCACAAGPPDRAGSSLSPDRAASPSTWVGR